MLIDALKRIKTTSDASYRGLSAYIHMDFLLFTLVTLLCFMGLIILFSASNQQFHVVQMQLMRYGLSFIVMFLVAQIPPSTWQRSALSLYFLALTLLIIVLIIGHIGKGAQRWLNFGFLRFQPSELMKLAIPLLLASYYQHIHLPINQKSALIAIPMVLLPAILIARQPDLSTAILLTISGLSVLFLAGLSLRLIGSSIILCGMFLPFSWYFLHDYQRQRVLTFFNPERDPLGSGYHIIQSKIAIGSGGLFGKGWLSGTQSHLHFLPEHSTDFIFAVCGEEFGFIGSMILITLYILITLRGLYITIHAQDTFSRLVAGSFTLSFFVYFFTNIGMVTGILPVVGIPLPLISYGGSSMITIMAGFGLLMSIQTHRKLVTT